MPRNIVGAVVRGDDFYGRQKLVTQIWEKLETTNILLAGPRRFGKTSVMFKLLDQPKPGYKVIHIDLEPVKEPVDFIVALLDAIREDKKVGRFVRERVQNFKDVFDRFEITVKPIEDVEFKVALKEKIKKRWSELGDAVLKELSSFDENLVIVLDEFAIMIENFLDDRLAENEVREFLHWFRNVRIDPSATSFRFVIGSSISIDHRLSKLGIVATFNDFEKMVLREFEDERTASRFVEALTDGKKAILGPAGRQRILELVGPPIPYFIQVLVSEVLKVHVGRGKRVTPKEIERIYHDQVLGVSCKTYFQHYYDRLKHYDVEKERAAKALLKHLALAGQVERAELYQQYLKETQAPSDPDGFNDLMSDLENDFYIKFIAETNSYVFFCKILRDWWSRYYSL